MKRFSNPWTKFFLLLIGLALLVRPLAVILHNHLGHTGHAPWVQDDQDRAQKPLLKKHFHELHRLAKQNPRPKLDLLPALTLTRTFAREGMVVQAQTLHPPCRSPWVTLRI